MRVLLGMFSLWVLVVLRAEVTDAVPRSGFWEPVGIARIFADPPPVWVRWAVWAGAMLGGVLFAAGVRFGGVLLAVGLWLFGGLRCAQGTMYHDLHLLLLQVMALSTAGGRSGWGLRLTQVLTLLTYSMAGWAKAGEPGADPVRWAESLWNHVAHVALGRIYFNDEAPNLIVKAILAIPERAHTPLGFVTLGLELLAPLALLHRYLLAAWLLALWGMHLGIWAAMGICFPFQTWGLGFVVFLPHWIRWGLVRTAHPQV